MPTKTSATPLCLACRSAICPPPTSSVHPLRHAAFLSSHRPPSHPRLSRGGSDSNTVTAWRRRRHYSQSSRPGDNPEASNQPPPWPSSPNPTPYEILGMSRRDVYTKRRFHQLVKLYHPDMTAATTSSSSSSTTSTLSRAARTERYRLVVAANDLLSDPDRRRAYDLHGVGWSYGASASSSQSYRDRDREWRHRPGSAARNVTWEDWEAWRRQYHPRQQQEHQQYGDRRQGFAHNNMNGFGGGGGGGGDGDGGQGSMMATLIVIACIVGALAQTKRVKDRSAGELDRTARAAALEATRAAGAGMSRDERIEAFVRERENSAFRYRPKIWEPARPEGGVDGKERRD